LKIVGVLSAHDESPSWLAAAVAGFGRFCDAIVYAEGAYAQYPGARARSYPAQAEAVMAAAEAVDTELLIHRPKDVYWGNEVAKRNQTFALAGSLSPDWLCVFDADFLPMQVKPEIIRWELENTGCNVATYTLLDSKDLLADPETAVRVAERPADTEWTCRTRDFYRWTPDLTYGPAHYTIQGTYDGETQWIRGPELMLPTNRPDGMVVVAAHDLLDALVVYHRTQERARVRREAADGYYRTRDQLGFEKILPEKVAR
jgi:hypothetical protein